MHMPTLIMLGICMLPEHLSMAPVRLASWMKGMAKANTRK